MCSVASPLEERDRADHLSDETLCHFRTKLGWQPAKDLTLTVVGGIHAVARVGSESSQPAPHTLESMVRGMDCEDGSGLQGCGRVGSSPSLTVRTAQVCRVVTAWVRVQRVTRMQEHLNSSSHRNAERARRGCEVAVATPRTP